MCEKKQFYLSTRTAVSRAHTPNKAANPAKSFVFKQTPRETHRWVRVIARDAGVAHPAEYNIDPT